MRSCTVTSRSISRLLIAALMLAMVLTGCSQKVSSMTPDESRLKLTVIFDETVDLVGGSWKIFEDDVPQSCKKADQSQGVQYSDLRTSRSDRTEEDAKNAADVVADLWIKGGYEVTQSFHSVFGHEVSATSAGRSDLSFGVTPLGMSLLGGSDCVDGDLDEIIHQLPDPTTGIEDLE